MYVYIYIYTHLYKQQSQKEYLLTYDIYTNIEKFKL